METYNIEIQRVVLFSFPVTISFAVSPLEAPLYGSRALAGVGTLECTCTGKRDIFFATQSIGNDRMVNDDAGCENFSIGVYSLYFPLAT